MVDRSSDALNQQFIAHFEAWSDRFEMLGPKPAVSATGRSRGLRDRSEDPNRLTLSLHEQDGILRWELNSAAESGRQPSGMRARGGVRDDRSEVLRREFTKLGVNEIGKYLESLDDRLNPIAGRGLRSWLPEQNKLVEANPLPAEGRFLLIVHGTFSKSDHLLDDLKSTESGRKFLSRAAAHYNRVLTFDHPTLSVSPMLNALDLVTALGTSRAEVDIVCHSRGGLVCRWWMEVLDREPLRRKRAVFVASPLSGTSLASPPRLKAGLNLLANYSKLLGAAAMALPFAAVPAALLRVIGSVVGVGAKLPFLDAAVAMIPGLSGQSRVGNCYELQRLNRGKLQKPPAYFFVTSNFQSEKAGWKIWKYITEGKQRAADLATDLLVFKSDNDLVVDTESMTELPDRPTLTNPPLLDFGTTAEVHHTNYFVQPKTVEFIENVLEIP
jgi:hypothetical protein